MTAADDLAEKIRASPVWFVKTFFGETLVGKQPDIIEALRDFKEVLVPSCHDSGKTFIAARALLWFLMAHPNDSIVLSTAPTFQQVVELLWREVANAKDKAKFPLGGRLLQAKYEIAPKWFALGITSDDPVNYTGYHASNILLILDEADGVQKPIWDALEGVLTSANAKILAIGNPLDPTSEFAARARNARAPRSKVIRIAADDVLPLTDTGGNPYLLQRGWVNDKKEKWGENSALYLGKVLAQWPSQNIDTLIPIPWLLRARARAVPKGIRTYGVDVARFGANRTVRTLLEGNWLVWSKATEREDTVQTTTRVMNDIRQFEPANVQIDETGIGGAVVDQLRKQLRNFPVIGVNNGGKAVDDEHYANRGSEMWWMTRTAFEKDEIGFDMSDVESIDELIADLNRPTYAYNRRGQLIVDKYGLPRGTSEYGLTTEERSDASPDRGDSYVLAYTAAKPFIDAGRTTIRHSYSYMPKVPEGVVRA